jgi:thioredoxin 1
VGTPHQYRRSPDLKDVTGKDFNKEVIQSKIPVVVDFWATYCGPCKMFANVLEKIEIDAEGDFKIVKVNVETENTLAGTYGVMSVPTLVVFNQGKVVGNHVGAGTKATIEKKIRSMLPK